MKPRHLINPHILFIGSLALLPLASVQAQTTGTWNPTPTTGLTWNTVGNWTGLTLGQVPNAVGATPSLSVSIGGSRTITLDGDKIVGTLAIGDTGATYFAFTLNAGSPVGRLIMDQTGTADATISLPTAANTEANVINAGILLNDNLVLNTLQTTASATALTLGGVIDDGAGSFSITKQGASIVAINGANTYDGGTTLKAGRVNCANAAGFGTGPVTVEATSAGAAGAQAYLLVSAAPYANNFTINGIGYTETAGNIGAIRYQAATTTGSLTVASDARIGAYSGSTGNLNGALIGSAGINLELNSSSASHNGTFNLNGSSAGFLGALTLNQGRLNMAATTNLGGSLTVKDGASLSGEATVAGAITLGNAGSTATGPNLYIDPSTSDSLHTNGNLTLNGKTTVFLTGPVTGSSAKVLSYSGTLSGTAANLDLAGGGLATYRPGCGFDFSVANQVSLTLVTGEITWTGAASGSGDWNTTASNWNDGTSSTAFYNLDAVTFDDTAATKAALTTNLANALQNDLVFTAVASGAAGEAVTIEYVNPGVANSPLSVTVTGNAISVSLGTDSSSAITSTATGLNGVKEAIEASGPASALVTVALAASNDGSGLVAALSPTPLVLANPTINLASGVTVSPGDMTFDHSAIDYTVSGSGVIIGGGSLTKSGTGMLSLSTANSFAGGSALTSGRLRIGNTLALGTAPITITGGQFSSVDTGARALANGAVMSGSFILGDTIDTGAITFNGASMLAANTTIAVPTAATITHAFGGVITDGASSFSLTKQGATGTLALNGANTYDGGTVIEAGPVNAGNASSFGTGPVTVQDGGQAFLTVAGSFANTFAITGIGYSSPSGSLGAIRLTGSTVSGPITLAGDSRITAFGSTGTLAGAIGETGGARSLELSNYNTTTGSTITVSGDNAFSGGTSVKGAIVIGNHNNAFGTGPVTIESNGTATIITRVQLGTDVVINNDITINSSAQTGFRGAVHSYAGSLTTPSLAIVNGDIEIQGAMGNGGHLAAESASLSVLRVMGAVNVTNATIPLVRVGTVELGGGGNYTQLNHGEGTLRLAAANGINPAAALNLGLSGASVFDLNGFGQTLAGLTKGSFNATVTNNGASGSTLTLNMASAGTYAGTFGTGTSALNLVKSGAGILTLAGASASFLDSLAVIEGGLTLSANGSVAPSVAVGGNLDVSGGINVSLQSMPVVPSPIQVISYGGTLTGSAGNFVLNGAANYRSPVFAAVAGTPNAITLTFGAPVDLTWNGASGNSDWDIATTANWAGSGKFYLNDSVTFDDTALSGTSGSASFTTAIVNSDNDLVFTAKTAGVAGELVSIRYNASTDPDQSLSVSVTGNAITVNLATDAFGFVSSTSAAVKAAIEASPSADALVTVTFATGDETGLGFVAAVPKSFLDLAKTENVVIPTGVTVSPSGIIFANNALDYEVDGPGSISGSGGLLKSGNGKVGIYSTNSFTGDTVISKGELIAGATNALGTGAIKFGDANTTVSDVCTVTLATGPLTLANPSITVESTCLNARISSNGGTINNTTITMKSAGSLQIGNPANTNVITGTSNIVVGKGTLTCTSKNPLSSTTTVTLGDASTGSENIAIEMPTSTGTDTISGFPIVVAANSDATSKTTLRLGSSGWCTHTGAITLNRDLWITKPSGQTGGESLTGKISGTGNLHFDLGAGIPVRLRYYSGTTIGSDYVGDMYIHSGRVQFWGGVDTSSTSYNVIPDATKVIMSAGTTLSVSSSEVIGALEGGASEGALGVAAVSSATSSTSIPTLTVGGTNLSGVFAGSIRNESTTKLFKLTKTGTGTQTLNGACTHTGATTVSQGKLVVNNTYTSAITVSAGATLGGNMTSTAAITATAAGAKIAPGNSTGTMTAASANLSTGGVMEMEIDDSSTPKNDKLAVIGTLNITSAALNLTVTGTAAEPVYVIASYGTLTGTFGTVTGKPSNYDLVYNYNDGGGSNKIALVKQTDAYLGWLAAFPTLTGANRAPGVDFDNDGLDNGIEFVIGTNPTTATGSGAAGYPAATVTGGNMVFTFKRSTASKAYPVTVETSLNLATWPPANAYLVPTVDTAGSPVAVSGESVTVTIPMAPDAKKFARVKADIPFTP